MVPKICKKNFLQGCQPYAKSAFIDGKTPACANTCLNTDYKTPYQQDKHFGIDHYAIAKKDVLQIQTEILTNYDDFYNYYSDTSPIGAFRS
jgi:hypothetical protein